MWQKLTEVNFRSMATSRILLQVERIEKLSTMITKLSEDIFSLKKQLGNISIQNVRLNRKLNTSNQKMNDDTESNQAGSSNAVSQPREPHI